MFSKKINPFVKCSDCSTIVDRETCNKVKVSFITERTKYYCDTHAKKYDVHIAPMIDGGKYLKIVPAKIIEVDVNGKEVKAK
jgi:hypothetical protein